MDYAPNIEAVSFFVERIWSKIRAVHRQARFLIVGASPKRKVLNLARKPGVEVTGYVPDIRRYLTSATLAIAPMAIARGVQNKILEAMAAGVPVLTSPAVAKGLPPGAERHVFVAEREPEAFESALLRLIGNPLVLEEKSAAAQNFVKQHCTWEIKLRTLDELLEKVTTQMHSRQIAQG
jgi:glycosyltransferase involved in cell wall biosynthesis